MTGTCKIMFQSLFGSLLNHLYRYGNENASVKSDYNGKNESSKIFSILLFQCTGMNIYKRIKCLLKYLALWVQS